MPPTTTEKIDPADALRDALNGLLEVANILSPYCSTVPDLVGMVELATVNDGQLRILLEKLQQSKGKTR